MSKQPPTNNRLTKPANIYRRGKQQQITQNDQSSESEQEQEQEQKEDERSKTTATTTFPIINITNTKSLNQQQTTTTDETTDSSSSSSEEEEEEEEDQHKTKKYKESKTKPGSTSSDDDSSSSESGSSSSEEEESDESEKLAPIYKPMFITKRNRETIPPQQTETEEDLERKRLEEEERRKKASQKLVEETLLREIAEKEVDQVFPDVDDTDGLDPEAEFEAWKLRELKRLRRDREALIQRAKEKEEIEARRMMPESERLKEDLEYAEKTRKAKPKGKQVFLQKYHHKGAFYADSDIHKKHDYTAPTEGTFTKMELLPAVMQVRDFGKMSRTKWTHLVKEDTTSFDAGWSKKNPGRAEKSQEGCFGCGERGHLKRDCPKALGGPPGQGSNRVALGARPQQTNEARQSKRRGSDDDPRGEKEYPSKRRDSDRERSSGRLDDRERRRDSPPPRREDRERPLKDKSHRPDGRDRRDRSPPYSGRHHERDRRSSSPQHSGRHHERDRRSRSPPARREDRGDRLKDDRRRPQSNDRRDRSPVQPRRESQRERRDYSPRRPGRERDRSRTPLSLGVSSHLFLRNVSPS
ncbi:hypothetical protein PCASD_10265 [Puccinia coronata f. sp. avenae]|uniref:CCHC-type domain-containing protein n=1 Tax=Puccinia coronata f. sp. avenae TaxID=200324 RepID=A0A2N5UII1_9BASI|nr:hypothetical protein PCASD_10265 [Puccinia coronata f. sp. avenae]